MPLVIGRRFVRFFDNEIDDTLYHIMDDKAQYLRQQAETKTVIRFDEEPLMRIDLLIKTFLLFILVVYQSSVLAVENWPGFRGPTKQGHVEGADLPLHWSESKNVAWKVAIDGKAWSTPAIWGDRIFLTNAPEEGTHLSVVCIDTKTGKTIYDKQLHSVTEPQFCHAFNSYASPSPVLEEGRLYVTFGSPYTACLEPTSGDVLWQRTDFVCNHFRGPGSSPLIHNDKLILHFDGSDAQYVVAMNKATGDTIWNTKRSVDFQDIDASTGQPERDGDWRKAYSTPIIADVDGIPILISLGSKALYGYHADTGSEIWRFEFTESHSGACRPIVNDGVVYAAIGSAAELWAIRPNGNGIVTDTHVDWRFDRAVPRRASPLLVDGLIFMVSDDGVAACVEAATGKQAWRRRLGGNFSASPIHSRGRIYFFDQDGKCTILKASREYEVLAENQLENGFMASPAVTGNALILRTRTDLYRIENKQ